jgi:dihydrofolate reductase
MSKLILHNMTSLDGFYAGPNGELDWHYADAEHDEVAVEMLDSAEALLCGRITYEMMAAYWPSAPSDPVADRMNALPKLVFSKTLEHADWSNTRLIKNNAAHEISVLKQSARKNLVILGSANLAANLIAVGLVDELHVMICPILLGNGKPLALAAGAPNRLEIISSHTRRSGVVDLRYQCCI